MRPSETDEDLLLTGEVSTGVGQDLTRFEFLETGSAGDRTYKGWLADGSQVFIKRGSQGSSLHLEGAMTKFLAGKTKLPVPEVLYSQFDLLVLEWIDHEGGLSPAGQEEAADMIAQLHKLTDLQYGFPTDTVIAGLKQPNAKTADWVTFFAEKRLMHMALLAVSAGTLDRSVLKRVEKLAGQLGKWIKTPNRPSLLHGDLWTGNILCRDGRVVAFVDPAIYFGDAEVELAFTTLFGTFGEIFFDRYKKTRPLAPGFFEERRDLYNLYPLLVHTRLFGGSYALRVERTLDAFGC